MRNNLIFKILASLPIILITLYFIPFLGVCLILLRLFMYDYRKRISTPIIISIFGILLLIPKGLDLVFEVINFDSNKVKYLSDIINSNIYINLINYSKFLISLGIILLIISFILRNLLEKIGYLIKDYIIKIERKNSEISEKNDMEIKLKQQRAKTTNFIKCPNCGADNIVTEKIGTCKYCRRKLENDKYVC